MRKPSETKEQWTSLGTSHDERIMTAMSKAKAMSKARATNNAKFREDWLVAPLGDELLEPNDARR